MKRLRILVTLEEAAAPLAQAEFTVAAGTPVFDYLAVGTLVNQLADALVRNEAERERAEADSNRTGIDGGADFDWRARRVFP